MSNNTDLKTVLPTAEEYKENVIKTVLPTLQEWSQPKYQCPKCSGGMCKDLRVVLTTYPAQYKYQCQECGYTEYLFG